MCKCFFISGPAVFGISRLILFRNGVDGALQISALSFNISVAGLIDLKDIERIAIGTDAYSLCVTYCGNIKGECLAIQRA